VVIHTDSAAVTASTVSDSVVTDVTVRLLRKLIHHVELVSLGDVTGGNVVVLQSLVAVHLHQQEYDD
jgi:hypothetical protein